MAASIEKYYMSANYPKYTNVGSSISKTTQEIVKKELDWLSLLGP